MPIYRVNRRQSLLNFLLRLGCQIYRIPILLNCKGVTVLRNSKLLKLQHGKITTKQQNQCQRLLSITNTPAARTPLLNGDYVRINNSTKYNKTLEQIPIACFRDYAFSPVLPKDHYTKRMNELMQRCRPQTILVTDPTLAQQPSNLVDFIQLMHNGRTITHPIRDILIVSHSHPWGSLSLPLDSTGGKKIFYEDLLVLQNNNAIQIPQSSVLPRPKHKSGTPSPFTIHIKGCNIGKSIPFMNALSVAFGGDVLITAPKHFHMVSDYQGTRGEYMCYSFEVNRRGPFRDHKEAIQVFRGQGFLLYNRSPISLSQWQQWIPRNPNQIIHSWKVRVNCPKSRWYPRSRKLSGLYMHTIEYYFKKNAYFKFPTDPGSDSQRKQAIQDELEKQRPFRDSLYPQYERYGYKTMDEFMDGWKWSFLWDKAQRALRVQAKRHKYIVKQPIVDPSTQTLIMNIYPPRGRDNPIINLREDDPRFFESAFVSKAALKQTR
jgi:hypothetical protein